MTRLPPPAAHDPATAHDPAAAEVPDLRKELDAARARCPVHHDSGTYTLLGHAEVVAAATDPEAFSSAASRHRAIPNSLDGAEHAAYREIVDRYLTRGEVDAQEPQCRAHAQELVAGLQRGAVVRILTDYAVPYAVRTQLTWLGWPAGIEGELVAWMGRNREASRSGDYARTAAVAAEFDAIVERMVTSRDGSGEDVTSRLIREYVDGRPLTRQEIVSVLRNWTAGDLGSLATSLGVVVQHLADHPEVQEEVRGLVAGDGAAGGGAAGSDAAGSDPAGSDAAGVEAAIEEILRIDDPFVSNRRVTTRDLQVAGVEIPQGARVVLNWTAANRDPAVFGDPDAYRPAENAADNLVFGIGPHVCPGRALSLMELRVAVSALLEATTWVHPVEHERPVRMEAPGSGWARVPAVLE